MGDEFFEEALQDEKTEDEPAQGYCMRTARSVWTHVGSDGLGVRRKNAVRTTLKHVFAFENYNMVEEHKSNEHEIGYRQSHTMETQMVEGRGGGRVAQLGKEWSSKKDVSVWKTERISRTFALDDNVTQSVAHRPIFGEEIKENEMKKEPCEFGTTRFEDFDTAKRSHCQMCGDNKVVDKCINGYNAVSQKFRELVGGVKKDSSFVGWQTIRRVVWATLLPSL